MAANTQRTNEGTDYPRFTPVGRPQPVTETDIVAMTEIEHATDGDTTMYAVARVDGVLHTQPGIEGCADALSVLYVTADGAWATERWHAQRSPGDLAGIPAVITTARDRLSQAGPNARQAADIALPAHAAQNTIQTETEDGGGQ